MSEGWPDQEGRWPQGRIARGANAWLSKLGDSELRARPEGGDPMPETERKVTGRQWKVKSYTGQVSTGGRDYWPQHRHVRSRLDHGNEASGRVYS